MDRPVCNLRKESKGLKGTRNFELATLFFPNRRCRNKNRIYSFEFAGESQVSLTQIATIGSGLVGRVVSSLFFDCLRYFFFWGSVFFPFCGACAFYATGNPKKPLERRRRKSHTPPPQTYALFFIPGNDALLKLKARLFPPV